MKIRMGFVSNSSSSSFCIYGVCLEQDDIREYFGFNGTFEDYEEIYDFLNENLPEDIFISDLDADVWYIGKELKDCPDDMTLGDYKTSIKDKLIKIPSDKFDIYEESLGG